MTTEEETGGPVRLVIEIAGKRTVVRFDAFDGRDIKLCREETGHAPQYWINHQDEWDLDIIAMLVWLTRRRLSRGLTYEKVLESITYENFTVVGDEGEDEDDPEG